MCALPDVPVVSAGLGVGVAEDLSYHANGLSNGTVIKRKKGRKPKNLENINGNSNHCTTTTKRKSREGKCVIKFDAFCGH